MNNEIKLNKRQEETLKNIEKQIELMGGYNEDDWQFLYDMKEQAFQMASLAKKSFRMALETLADISAESAEKVNATMINEDLRKSMKDLNKEEKKLNQARKFESKINHLVLQQFEKWGK